MRFSGGNPFTNNCLSRSVEVKRSTAALVR
jgi:hypothetical protein